MDFVIVAYGLAISPAEEEPLEIMRRVEAAGHDAAAVERAGQLADAAVALADSDFADGTDRFERLRTRAAAEGWLGAIAGDNITSAFSDYPLAAVRLLWRRFEVDTSWHRPARAVVAALDVPQLWILGARDEEAPGAGTVSIRQDLQAINPDLQIQVFDAAGHGVIERPPGAGHPRQRYVDGYHRLLIDFIAAQ